MVVLVMQKPDVTNSPLVSRSRIILLHSHIKLGLMKQYAKALNTDGKCFEYIIKMFPPRFSSEKYQRFGNMFCLNF